jgi:hypothetical protein
VEIFPYVPIAYNLRISIGIFSYLDQLNFGITADFDAEPDIGVLAAGIREGFDELVALAAPVPPEEPAVTRPAAARKAAPRRRPTSAATSRGRGGGAKGP